MATPLKGQTGFKIEASNPSPRFPQLCVFMGLPKIGKSTAMAKLPKALICDLEGKGYKEIEAPDVVKVYDSVTMRKVIKYFFSKENKEHKILVIDHIRMLTTFWADSVKNKHTVKFIEDVNYGKGTAELRSDIEGFLRWVNMSLSKQDDKYVFLVAHAIDRNSETRLDIDGKNESIVLGAVDAVGFINRNNDGETTINFKARKSVEFGARNRFLAGYDGVLDWSKLFKLAKGEKVE